MKLPPVPSAFPDMVPASYTAWKAEPTPTNMAGILKEVDPLIRSELSKYRGTLPEAALHANAKKVAIEAIRNYSPNKGAKLTTHLVNTLQKLHRENYKYQQGVRMSEELQRGVGAFNKAKEDLTYRFGREPTTIEMADALAWPISRIERTKRQARGEIYGSDLEYDPADIEYTDTDPRLDFVYHDLTPTDQLIMEHTTGYGGNKTSSKKDIAKQLGVSQAAVTQRAKKIASKIADAMGWKV